MGVVGALVALTDVISQAPVRAQLFELLVDVDGRLRGLIHFALGVVDFLRDLGVLRFELPDIFGALLLDQVLFGGARLLDIAEGSARSGEEPGQKRCYCSQCGRNVLHEAGEIPAV